ncbi:hypothetical protein N7492_009920 [Penicillium capsulatum]|uniref:Uncharacterized protein n=1 Tax=Penicillium capsulatum TaxID=69766 RepID=A0A9W9LEY2_9EURO|nr:hypothetical protein N7492_009920 [Penicillium capsulatum]KAJ6112431.1 hypothetical protein N7512_007755 [Penicillium capsulatum]
MASKIVFVTGGNGGIGYETVKEFVESEKPYHILMGSRSVEKAKKSIEKLHVECPQASNVVEAVQLDLTSDESIEQAFDKVQADLGYIDALINNAGATFDLDYVGGRVSLRDCFNNAYNVNVAGTHVMTATFIPLLLKSNDPRLIFVSGLSNITQAGESYFPTPPLPSGWPKQVDFETIGYRCSKTALSMLMLDWNHKLQADGVKVWCVAPGFLATNLGNAPELAVEMGAKHPSIGGRLIKRVVEGERDGSVGKLVAEKGVMSW